MGDGLVSFGVLGLGFVAYGLRGSLLLRPLPRVRYECSRMRLVVVLLLSLLSRWAAGGAGFCLFSCGKRDL